MSEKQILCPDNKSYLKTVRKLKLQSVWTPNSKLVSDFRHLLITAQKFSASNWFIWSVEWSVTYIFGPFKVKVKANSLKSQSEKLKIYPWLSFFESDKWSQSEKWNSVKGWKKKKIYRFLWEWKVKSKRKVQVKVKRWN